MDAVKTIQNSFSLKSWAKNKIQSLELLNFITSLNVLMNDSKLCNISKLGLCEGSITKLTKRQLFENTIKVKNRTCNFELHCYFL